MKICLAGPINGRILDTYLKARLLGAEYILCTGSVGIWPDPQRLDTATRRYGCGDFAELYLNQWDGKIPLLFVAGPNEDHEWLRKRLGREKLLPNLQYLENSLPGS